MSMSGRSAGVKTPHTSATCHFCGEWPATLYVNLSEKHGKRVCETCVENGTVIRSENGVYVVNPELTAPEPPADPAESQ